MTASDHLNALLSHGVRVDCVLYDPNATLCFEPHELSRRQIEPLPRAVASETAGVHDQRLLQLELRRLFSEFALEECHNGFDDALGGLPPITTIREAPCIGRWPERVVGLAGIDASQQESVDEVHLPD